MRNRHAGHREALGRGARTAVLAALLLTAYAAAGGPHATEHGVIHWGYGVADGPRNWWRLDPAYRLCGLGRYQSPIDIRRSQIYRTEPEPLRFDYNTVPLRVIDNGHTIQVNYGPGSTMRIGSHAYELVQFHFHLPSEERIDGKAFAMVAHLVHRDAEGRLAVVAALLVEGSENPLFENVLDHLPETKGDERTVLYRPINALRLLPARLDYYAYIGSLTTPPCSEGVNWYVLRQPVEISRSQIERFRRLYRDNVRPIQPINGRPVRAGG